MKLGIMQPYFFPYIGYWQLILASDVFVLLDDVQYIRHGWINRNRILSPSGGWQYIVVPLERHSATALIRNVNTHPNIDWKGLSMVRQLYHYKRKSRHCAVTIRLVETILGNITERSDARVNLCVCKLQVSSLTSPPASPRHYASTERAPSRSGNCPRKRRGTLTS